MKLSNKCRDCKYCSYQFKFTHDNRPQFYYTDRCEHEQNKIVIKNAFQTIERGRPCRDIKDCQYFEEAKEFIDLCGYKRKGVYSQYLEEKHIKCK